MPVPLLAILLLFSSCEREHGAQTTTFAAVAMTVPYRIVIGKGLQADEEQKVQALIAATFSEIDLIYNKWNPSSELSKLNQAAAGEKIPLPSKLRAFLEQTDRVVALTEGRFDPTIEPALTLWKGKLSQNRTPTDQEVQQVLQASGWSLIHLEDGIFSKGKSATQIDLGGIAKGYAIDLLIERLNREGYPDAYVEWGGEIRTSGKHPEDRPWRVLVTKFGRPTDEPEPVILELHNQAVASSGDYQQCWTVDGTTYSHIIDPQTARPLISTSHSICSVTIVADTCMLADALATAAMLFPNVAEAETWLKRVQASFPSVRYFMYTRIPQA